MGPRMLVVLAYDVTDDRRRRKLARVLDDWAQRVQGSVFEGWLTARQVEEMLSKASRVLGEGDQLRVYPLCTTCRGQMQALGASVSTGLPEFWIV